MRNGEGLIWIWAAVVLVLILQFMMMEDAMKRFDAIEDRQEGITDLLLSLGARYSDDYIYRNVDKAKADLEDKLIQDAKNIGLFE